MTKNTDNLFSISLFTPWVKGEMSVDRRSLTINLPKRTFYGLIPIGRIQNQTPIAHISNVRMDREFDLKKVGIGALGLFFGVIMFMASFTSSSSFMEFVYSFFGGAFLMIFGAGICGAGISTVFSYQNSGSQVALEFPFFEAKRIQLFADEVKTQVYQFHDDRNVAVHSRENADRVVEAINGLK